MSDIILAIFGTLGVVLENLTSSLSTAFDRLLWKGVPGTDGVMTYVQANGLSTLAAFMFTVIGIGIAVGLFYMLFRLIRNARR